MHTLSTCGRCLTHTPKNVVTFHFNMLVVFIQLPVREDLYRSQQICMHKRMCVPVCVFSLALDLALTPEHRPLFACLSGWCSMDSSAMLKQGKHLERDNGSLDF
ncbi:hypothetical protein XENOCAPTIV_019042 [Xenoophorus captivus]|uniref:Uncharacterized protein n=1 Tax=Xenoophorus captivus TaxID=1517983 RepID=A0ABV0QM84_9TELE